MSALPATGPCLSGLSPQSQSSLTAQTNPGSTQLPPPPQGVLREIPPAILCKIGQETVQDIVSRTMEIFHLLRSIQLPNGVTQSQAVYQDRFCKLQEHLRQLTLLFRKLRLLYEKCAEMTSDLDKLPTEMVPYINEDNQDEISTFQGSRESQEILEKVKLKNEGMKVLMDQMRQLLWDINSMLTLRK